MNALPIHALPLRLVPARAKPSRRVFHRPDTVACDVCERFGVTFEAVAGRKRGGQVGAARAELCRALRERTAMTLHEVGAFLGGRCHGTIIALVKSTRGD